MDAKDILIEQLKKEALKPDGESRCGEIYQQYGMLATMDISRAISPINPITAPLLIAYLEGYANELRRKFPEAVPIAEVLKKARTVTIEKEITDDKRRW